MSVKLRKGEQNFEKASETPIYSLQAPGIPGKPFFEGYKLFKNAGKRPTAASFHHFSCTSFPVMWSMVTAIICTREAERAMTSFVYSALG